MNILKSKFKEVSDSLIPIVLFVAFIILTLVPTDLVLVYRFLIGAAFVLLGLSLFLWGVDQCMNPIGKHMAKEIAKSRSIIYALLLSCLLGFLITVAEPDLLILGNQVEGASGGILNSGFIVTVVSFGVGVLISLGALRVMKSGKYRLMMAFIYLIIAVLAVFVAEEFLAISFDASGATTGALTTPFVLSLSLGLSKAKGGKLEEADAFGLVGAMSAGPVIAIMLMSILSNQRSIQSEASPFSPETGIFAPIFNSLKVTFMESLFALLPIAILFYLYNIFRFKRPASEILKISRGLIYSLLGLAFFLTGANQGFMDMGHVLGMGLTGEYKHLLIPIGFALGFIVVVAEPAVHVLGEQIDDVTSGSIPPKIIRLTLSIGVGMAVALSMLRITVPEVRLWYFLLPGFLIAVLLSFYVDPIFVGIAFDAGGVASGPMSATFLLALAQGVADRDPGADVLKDGFGMIAMIAMTPVLAIMVLGTLQKIKSGRKSYDYTASIHLNDEGKIPVIPAESPTYECLVCVADSSFEDEVIDFARSRGAGGATVMHARDARAKAWSSYSLNFDPERSVIWFLLKTETAEHIASALMDEFSGEASSPLKHCYMLPVGSVSGLSV